MNTRVLIIDRTYLVAMDVENILKSSMACDVSIGTPESLEDHLRDQSYTAVILESDAFGTALAEAVNAILMAGAALIFLTTNSAFMGGIPGQERYPVLLKPFSDHQLKTIVAGLFAPLSAPAA
ncbi:response regulator [Roseibium suaedae]|uniref:Response regulatory domain-containing protein n=1 Tax=Roseibium suaedae TaxID=735517 RepID=A0A1M7D0S3_9HYPH|nr:hypothetical protein [Roseibium suaedae]SHL73038.1 hypothetical protein SAMN05444272_1332 [Roseibium suaedae]